MPADGRCDLNLNLLTTTIVAPPSNASKWQMGCNSAFKGLKHRLLGSDQLQNQNPLSKYHTMRFNY